MIKATGSREILFLLTEMPLAHGRCAVTCPFEYIGHGGLVESEAAHLRDKEAIRPDEMRALKRKSMGLWSTHRIGIEDAAIPRRTGAAITDG